MEARSRQILTSGNMLVMALCSLCLAACASFEPQPIDVRAGPGEILTREIEGITVSTTILSDAQAERQFGADLAAAGLQAVWLQVQNDTDHSYWLLVSALDAEYFPPDEAAALFHGQLSAEDEVRINRHFRELAIPLKHEPGTVNEGFVIAPRHEGGRYVFVGLLGNQQYLDFGFAVSLPDGGFDFESLEPNRIYAERDRPDLGPEEMRSALRELPCCVTDKEGVRDGDPLNLVLIGSIHDVLISMQRAEWSFTHRISAESIKRMIAAALSGASYAVAPVSPLYLFGRPQDLAMQRSRNTIIMRNHLRLWLAPFRFEGKSVWVGQVSRDIGVKATSSSATFTTHVIDPNVDESRESLLQNLIVAGAIKRFGFVEGAPVATPAAPRSNLSDDPYYSDGVRLLVEVSGSSLTPPEKVEFLEWRNSADPLFQELTLSGKKTADWP